MRHARRHHHGRRQRRGVFSRVAYAFRERQIYLRSEGEVQFITLRPWVQVAAVAAFCAGLFWVAYATVNVAFKDQVLALKERNQYRARLEYEDRIGELRSTIDRLNRRLLLDQRAYLAKIDELRAEHDKLVDRHDRLAEFFQNGWLPRPAIRPAPAPAKTSNAMAALMPFHAAPSPIIRPSPCNWPRLRRWPPRHTRPSSPHPNRSRSRFQTCAATWPPWKRARQACSTR